MRSRGGRHCIGVEQVRKMCVEDDGPLEIEHSQDEFDGVEK